MFGGVLVVVKFLFFVWLSWVAFSSFTALQSVREPVVLLPLDYNKSPAYEPSSCELSKMWTWVPSASGLSEIAACPHLLLLTILQLCHLPTPRPSPVSNPSCPFIQYPPLSASCCTILLYFSRHCTVRLNTFIFCVCFLHIICVKSIINLLQYSPTSPIC